MLGMASGYTEAPSEECLKIAQCLKLSAPVFDIDAIVANFDGSGNLTTYFVIPLNG